MGGMGMSVYRVTLVVEYLSWSLHSRALRPFLPDRGQLGRIDWVTVQDWWNSQINVNPPDHQSHPVVPAGVINLSDG